MANAKPPTVTMQPLGMAGLDANTPISLLPAERYARGENIRNVTGIERRYGRARLSAATDVTAAAGSWTYGTTADYASIPAATQQLIPVGGFGVYLHFRATRNANTGVILASRVTGKAYGPFSWTLSAAGLLTVSWRKESDESAVSHTATITDGADCHTLLVYDPYTSGGRSLLYIDGVLSSTVTSVGESEQPMQDNPIMSLGVEWNPSGPGVTANSNFAGAIDTFCALAFAGRNVSAAGPSGTSLLDRLIRESFCDWRNPDDGMLLWQYPADEGSGTSLIDATQHKNHGTLVGSPSASNGVCRRCVPGNAAGYIERTDTGVVNYYAAGGRIYYETIKKGA